jgi:L-asparaginase II
MADVELVHVLRGGLIDCIHRGRVSVVDTAGKTLFAAGDADAVVYLRSCAKPFQALVVIRSGAAQQFALTTEELAVIAGSHNGTSAQTALVQGILDKIGADSGALQCGPGAPISRTAYENLLLQGQKPSALQHNCSGKHSGMLAACQARGWPLDGYLHADHPVQQMVTNIIAEYTDLRPADLVLALDGCGVPTFGLPLHRVALLFARLGAAARDASSELGIIARAMQQHPLLFSGEGRVDTALVSATQGRLISKDGAEGLLGIGVTDQRAGIALKISDGNQRAQIPIMAALMQRWGYLSADEAHTLDTLIPSTIRNNLGQITGEMRAVLRSAH